MYSTCSFLLILSFPYLSLSHFFLQSQNNPQVEHLAQCIIQTFEDSCSNEWMWHSMEAGGNNDQTTDGAYRYK